MIFARWRFQKTVDGPSPTLEVRLAAMPPEARAPLQQRLALARAPVGEIGALRLIERWHSPDEWVNASNLYVPVIRDERGR